MEEEDIQLRAQLQFEIDMAAADKATGYVRQVKKEMDDTAAAIDEQSDASKKNSDENKKSAGEMGKLGQSAGKAAELTGALSGAMAQGGPAAQQLGSGLRVVGAVVQGVQGGVMGLATVLLGIGISAIVAWRNKVAEAEKKIEDFNKKAAETGRAVEAARVDKLADQYDVLRRNIDEASSAQDRLNAARDFATNADKAVAMMDISLREKQALAALKPGDEVGSARVGAQFARERRDTESKYTVESAYNDAEARARALEDSERKLSTFTADIAALTDNMTDAEKKVREINEALADLYGKGAPTKQKVDPVSAGGFGGYLKYNTVVDDEEQAKQAAALRARLTGDDKTPGAEGNYMKIAEALAKAMDAQAKQAVEAAARKTEAEAAVRSYDAASKYVPAINAEDTSAEDRNVGNMQAAANADRFGGRLASVRERARIAALAAEAEAATFSAQDYRGTKDYRKMQGVDRDKDKEAGKFAQAEAAAKALEEKVKKMDPEALGRSLTSLTQQLDRIDKLVKDFEQRTKRAGSGG